MADELLLAGISEIGSLYRARKLSPVELAEALLNRIESIDPVLNAYVSVDADGLRAGARAAEKRLLRGGAIGPLDGIPISVKDNIATSGLLTTAGSRILQNWVPDVDAACVAALKQSGALIAGKTQLFEFAFGEAHSDYGHVKNPWDLHRSTGGSSSGSVAAVAAGLCFGSVGTDAGGSIRVPASLCGVSGFKPTFDLVDRSGVVTTAWSLSHVGTIGRSVADAAAVFHGLCPNGRHISDYQTGIRGLELGIAVPQADERIQATVAESISRVHELLTELGAVLHPVELPSLLHVRAVLWTIAAAEAADYHTEWLRDRPHDYHPVVRSRLETGWKIPATAYVRAQRVRRRFIDDLDRTLQGFDALLLPVSPITAYPLGARTVEVDGYEEEVGQAVTRYTPLASITGRPALSVPCGFSEEGLPIGFQIVGRPHGDEAVLRIGRDYEFATDWKEHHPIVDGQAEMIKEEEDTWQ